MGFCIFNNVAIGARHALRARGLERVLVIDWDVHHGNGIEVFAQVFAERLAPAAREFRPQLILVSAGYDSHADDPLGGLGLQTEDFGRLTRIVLDLADELCQGRVVIVLEGGYDMNALGASASDTIAELESRGVRR